MHQAAKSHRTVFVRPTSCPQMEGVQAALTPDDVLECEAALKRNARFRAVMAQRYGIRDVDPELAVDPWWAMPDLRTS